MQFDPVRRHARLAVQLVKEAYPTHLDHGRTRHEPLDRLAVDRDESLAPPAPTPTAAAAATATPLSSAPEEEAREKAEPPSGASAGSPLPSVASGQGLLYVYFFDVSLGDAIYIRTPSGQDAIIDGGDSRDELSAFLDHLGETAIDVVVASHPHADHIGGLPRVVVERPVGSIWSNGQTYTTNLYRDLEAAIAASSTTRNAGKVGDTFSLGGVTFTFLAPSRLGSNVNDNSLVVRMDCGPLSFLFTGDAETGSENEMIVSGQPRSGHVNSSLRPTSRLASPGMEVQYYQLIAADVREAVEKLLCVARSGRVH